MVTIERVVMEWTSRQPSFRRSIGSVTLKSAWAATGPAGQRDGPGGTRGTWMGSKPGHPRRIRIGNSDRSGPDGDPVAPNHAAAVFARLLTSIGESLDEQQRGPVDRPGKAASVASNRTRRLIARATASRGTPDSVPSRTAAQGRPRRHASRTPRARRPPRRSADRPCRATVTSSRTSEASAHPARPSWSLSSLHLNVVSPAAGDRPLSTLHQRPAIANPLIRSSLASPAPGRTPGAATHRSIN